MKKLFFILAVAMMFNLTVCAQGTGAENTTNESPKEGTMKIKITIGGKECIATMYDNATARDFVSRLPLTAKLDDYSSTEKIFYPSPKLSTQGAPSGYDPSVGDICVYAPWGNICIFYRDFGYGIGLIPLGKIAGDMSAFAVSGSLTATFEVIK
jgi:hypothetical protein